MKDVNKVEKVKTEDKCKNVCTDGMRLRVSMWENTPREKWLLLLIQRLKLVLSGKKDYSTKFPQRWAIMRGSVWLWTRPMITNWLGVKKLVLEVASSWSLACFSKETKTKRPFLFICTYQILRWNLFESLCTLRQRNPRWRLTIVWQPSTPHLPISKEYFPFVGVKDARCSGSAKSVKWCQLKSRLWGNWNNEVTGDNPFK